MMAYISRLSQLKKCIEEAPEDSIIITERSLYTDKYVFAKMLYDNGYIEEIEYSIYLRWFDEFIENKIDSIIYIKTDPTVCLERIGIRNRKGEQSIPLEYLNSCHEYHENWINTTIIPNKEISILNGNDFIEINVLVDCIHLIR